MIAAEQRSVLPGKNGLPEWTKFAWRLNSEEPMPEGREVLFWDRTAEGWGARVVVRSDGYVFDTVSGEALDWSAPCWWSFIPPVPPEPMEAAASRA